MTTQLTDRLRDLADEAPGPLTAGDLWQDGRRRHRRRLAGTLAVVGCLVAATAAVGVGTWRSVQPGPASPPATATGPLEIPEQLYNPSPWTPTTRTPGRLVALTSSSRDHFPFGSDRSVLVGVAAGSQTYRFLDLPGQSPDAADPQLSPDGLHVAYGIAPDTGSTPMNPGASAGFAVLDLVTGKVERYEVRTQFGLAVDSLTWLDADTIALVAGHFKSVRAMDLSGLDRTYFFTLGNTSGYVALAPADVRRIPVTTLPAQGCAPTCPGTYAQMRDGSRLMHVEASGRTLSSYDVRLSDPVLSAAFDTRRNLVAGTRGREGGDGPMPAPLMYGRVVGDRVRFHEVPGAHKYEQVFTWVDTTHVTTSRLTRDGVVYDVVDVRTGQRQRLTSKPWYAFSIAQDALLDPRTVPGVAPERPWNPRLIALGGLLVVVCAGGVVLVARRSVVRT